MNGHIQQFIFAVTLMITPILCFAFFCPTNFSQIDFGDSIERVTAQCGTPALQKESKKENENVPQEWSYLIPQTVATPSATYATTGVLFQTQGTLKTSMAFDEQGRVVNLSVNGIGVGATTMCGRNIQLGDTRDTVKSACGEPEFIAKNANPALSPPQKDIDVMEFTYNSDPPTTLIFENGVLTEKR